MEQIERIKQMEQHMDCASAAVMELSATLDKYVEAQKSITILNEYYGSNEWHQDYADDEAGNLPKDLKRGVLSEDGIWNLLSDCREMNVRLLETVMNIMKNRYRKYLRNYTIREISTLVIMKENTVQPVNHSSQKHS